MDKKQNPVKNIPTPKKIVLGETRGDHISLGKRTFGQKMADYVAEFGGSWTFIGLLILLLIVWIILNVTAYVESWDPYPFILMNLILSCLAAFQAPVILMSQNRQAQRDRYKALKDYHINKKAEAEIEDIQQDLNEIKKMLRDIMKEQEDLPKR
jgi:uncharacterized membrane protein